MIKVNLKTKECIRETLPKFLKGLKQESLQDLSWTDDSLGVQGYGWFPEVDKSFPMEDSQVYLGTDALIFNGSQVEVYKEYRRKTDEELQADLNNKASEVRRQRNTLLSMTDKYALQDVTLTNEMRAYRQALRDIPLQEGFPTDVVYPTNPEEVSNV